MVERFITVVEGNQTVANICVDLVGESTVNITVLVMGCDDSSLNTGRDKAVGESPSYAYSGELESPHMP